VTGWLDTAILNSSMSSHLFPLPISAMLRNPQRVSIAKLTRPSGKPYIGATRYFPSRTLAQQVNKQVSESKKPRTASSTLTSEESEAKKAIREARLRFKSQYWGYSNEATRQRLNDWNELGPPPLQEYRLTFGKHCGKKLDEVPLTYLVKYLIPRRHVVGPNMECPIVGEAIDDYMRRHPEVKSQAGRKKTVPTTADVVVKKEQTLRIKVDSTTTSPQTAHVESTQP
jgi:hypothetical protein